MLRAALVLLLLAGCRAESLPPLAVQGAVDTELGPLLEAIGHHPADRGSEQTEGGQRVEQRAETGLRGIGSAGGSRSRRT